MKEHFPNQQDRLFKEEESSNTGVWLDNPASNKFFLYSEGYKEAGKRLYEVSKESSFYKNLLVYPMVFSYRQFIELRLKELIIMGYKYLDMHGSDFPNTHNILELWRIYRENILPSIDNTIEKDILDNIEKIINEFHNEDPLSFAYRYPVTTGPARMPSINRKTLDIENFKIIIDKTIHFFDWQWDMISHYTDFKHEMISEMYGNY